MVRVKNRYLVVNYLYPVSQTSSAKANLPGALDFYRPTPDDFNERKLVNCIRDGVSELFGDYGMGMIISSLKINYHSTATSTSIIRCPTAHYEMIWAALTFMTKLPRPINMPVVVRVVRVTGTIRKAEEAVIQRAKDIVLRAKLSEDTPEYAGFVKDIVKAVETRNTANAMVNVDLDDEEGDNSDSD